MQLLPDGTLIYDSPEEEERCRREEAEWLASPQYANMQAAEKMRQQFYDEDRRRDRQRNVTTVIALVSSFCLGLIAGLIISGAL